MAEGEGSWWGGWFQQSFQTVKDKSAEAYEFIKRDLSEFSNVVQHDTTCSIVATANAVRSKLAVENSTETSEKVKKSLSNILGVITDTLAPPPDKTIDCDVITLVATPAGTTEVYDSTKARLYSLQADPATYCNEPDGPPEQFDAWLSSSFSLEEKKAEVSDLLVNSPSIRALYTKMVPAAVAHSEFWQRYFYKVFQLEQEEARRLALKQRAEQTAHRSERESLGWEEEEEDDFLGAASTSRLDFTPPLEDPSRASSLAAVALAAFCTPTPHSSSTPTPHSSSVSAAHPSVSPSASQGAFSPGSTSDVTPSVSSDSVSLPTQLEAQPVSPNPALASAAVSPLPASASASPQPLAQELSQRLCEASLEEEELVKVERSSPEPQTGQGEPQSAAQPEVVTDGPIPKDEVPPPPPAAVKTEGNKEDGPQDLRVFELNSDSGKSTPSNNGKKGSSTDVSEDWEKDFDLDMTEEEVQMALSKMDATGEMDEEDWENWD